MKLKLATIGMLAAVTAAPVFAGSTTHDLAVSATVTGNCRFDTAGPTDLIIGNGGGVIDPSSTTAATGQASVVFRCTTGTTSAIAADNGDNFSISRRVTDGTNFMPYSLALTGGAIAGTGYGAGQDKTLTVDATIAVADFENSVAGAYTDTVVLTITP